MSAQRALRLAAFTAAGVLTACASPSPRDEGVRYVSPPPPPSDGAWRASGAIVTSHSTPLALDEVLASVAAQHPQQLAAIADQAVAEGRQLAADGAFDTELRGRAL